MLIKVKGFAGCLVQITIIEAFAEWTHPLAADILEHIRKGQITLEELIDIGKGKKAIGPGLHGRIGVFGLGDGFHKVEAHGILCLYLTSQKKQSRYTNYNFSKAHFIQYLGLLVQLQNQVIAV